MSWSSLNEPLVNVAWLIKTWWLRRRDGFVKISVSVVRFKRTLCSRLEMPLAGTVTLPNRACNKSAGMLGSRRGDDVAPRLHRRGPEGSVRFCRGEMALDVESVVSGCVG